MAGPTSEKQAGSASLLAAAALLAAVVAMLVVGLSAAAALARLGIPDPGLLVTYGLPAVRASAEGAAAVAAGSLLLAAFLVPPQPNGVLDVGGYRAVRTAGFAAAGWAACALMLIPLTLSDVSGRPLAEALPTAPA